MTQSFDRRIVPDDVIALLRACQQRVPFHLGGGAALAGVHLRHRLSKDADLFVHDKSAHRELVMALPQVAAELGFTVSIVRDGGSFVRARAALPVGSLEIDIIHDAVPDIEATPLPVASARPCRSEALPPASPPYLRHNLIQFSPHGHLGLDRSAG